jgi:hypothetical protein
MVMELLDSSMHILGRTPSFDSVTRDVFDPSQSLSPSAGTCAAGFYYYFIIFH